MQQFTDIQSTETLANSRSLLLNNDKTIMSCHSGTAFPTTNLVVGMLCLRTDEMKLYQLKDLTPNWKLIFDLNKTAVDKEYVDAGLNNKVDKTSSNRPGVTKLYRRDSDANHNVQTRWDGSYWVLEGYSGDTFHAGCKVSRADSAGSADSVAWANVTGKPSTFTPPIASATQLGGVKIGANINVAADGTISVTFPAGFGLSSSVTVTGSTQGPFIPSGKFFLITGNILNQLPGVGAGTYTLQQLLQELVYRSHVHGVTTLNCNCNCDCDGGSCFVAGTLVLMVDFTWKPIEDIKPGDKVIGIDGKINTVIFPYSVKLGNKRSIIKFRDNSLIWSAEHLLWVRNENGEEYWGTHDYHQYLREKGLYNVDGIEVYYKGLTKKEPFIIYKEVEYAHLSGWKKQDVIIDRSFDENTLIYSMNVDGSHTYIVNGYVATGFVCDEDYDYLKIKWEPWRIFKHEQ